MSSIHERVRATRERLGWTQERVAAEVGIDQGQISRFERSGSALSIANLARLLEVLGLDVLPADHHGASADTVASDAVTSQPETVT